MTHSRDRDENSRQSAVLVTVTAEKNGRSLALFLFFGFLCRRKFNS